MRLALTIPILIGPLGCSTDDDPVLQIPPAQIAVRVAPDSATLAVGDTLRFQALVTNAFGGEPLALDVRFFTQDPEVATVTADGLVTAVSAGQTRVVAEVPTDPCCPSGRAELTVGMRAGFGGEGR